MTRTHENKLMETPEENLSIGETLREAVWQAAEQGRLTFGVHECARLLEIDPFHVMLCVLPECPPGLSDVSGQIKHMLIEAFCTEYDIRVVKVDNADKLTKVVLGRQESLDNAGSPTRPLPASSLATSVDCLLIQYPDNDPSKEEEAVVEFYKNSLLAEDSLHACFISLPD